MDDKPTCKTCCFWEPQSRNKPSMGECRRLAPHLNYNDQGSFKTVIFLSTRETHWCGDHPDIQRIFNERVNPTPAPIPAPASDPEAVSARGEPPNWTVSDTEGGSGE